MDTLIREALELSIMHHVPYCAFREPDSETVQFYSAPKPAKAPATDCFFASEFAEPFSHSKFIPFQLDAEQTVNHLRQSPNLYVPVSEPELANTGKEEYVKAVNALIEELKSQGIAKTVVSRSAVFHESLPPVEAFENILAKGKGLFCSCWYHPETGYWLGATPELLADCNLCDRSFRAVALAGTKVADEAWDNKNRLEQRIVSDYIAECLSTLGLSFTQGEVRDKAFGHLRHLATDFYGDMGCATPEQIIDAINPTPALCGYPKETALADIARCEKSSRGYYGGCIGYRTEREFKAFVNIRCINFYPAGAYVIRAGGGILASSSAEAEWQETERKISSLRSLIQPLTTNS